ncbi:MAG: T9SS type A sorting domain-containing protein [Bacteroidales bacterium]|nr:T9SS type A sorting domain-containing protein [Bacteroidales bacterium]
MKKTISVLSTLLLLATPAVAQRVMTDNFDELKVHYITPAVKVTEGEYLRLSADEYISGGELGAPALPVSNSLLSVPFCDGMTVEVTNAVYDTLVLPSGRVMPLQPSRSKSDTREPQMIIDESVYTSDAFYSRPLASVTPLGIGRDRNYAVLTWSPVSINPVSGKMVVCRSADVTVHYLGSDAGATLKHFERYYTPAFSAGPTLNSLVGAKSIRTTAPIRMVIMASQSLRCAALDEFADWKRQQGMLVDLIYQANGTAAATTAATLQQMYDEASNAAPAPTYLLLVGDIAQLPPFQSSLTSSTVNALRNYAGLDADHVTDLYFASWTSGDKLPDCYQGRFSATDTSTLRGIIEKTLFYERYQFPDDSYLGRAALVSGYDNGYNTDNYDNAWRCADPTMDYIAYYYVNADNGYNTVYYYKNDPSTAPDGVTVTGNSQSSTAASTLRTRYNSGLGWINYSAHGDWDGWYKPSLSISHANQMSNTDKPSFMIGSCCLSNKFDKGVCLGEALLRRGNRAGAIGYVGATNSTFWDEDFYWSVGVRSNVSHFMTPNYDSNRKGMYDRLFHTHGEAFSEHAYTAGQVLNGGNMSVQRAVGSAWSTAVAEYYWEIYELMGDPSLLPWNGTAQDLTASAVNVAGELTVTAVPYAYVALVQGDNHDLVSSAFADASGVAVLSAPATGLDATYTLSITAQGYKPYLHPCTSDLVAIPQVAEAKTISVSPNPASRVAEVRGAGLKSVAVLNMVGQQLQTVAAQGDRCTLDLQGIPAGLYLLRIRTAEGTSVKKLVVK